MAKETQQLETCAEILHKKTLSPEEKCVEWGKTQANQGLSDEWALAARLGQAEISDEQIHMVANLFGK